MKSKVLLLASLSVMGASQLKAQLNVGATGTPDASAILQLSSTTKGLRLPNVALSTTTTFTLTTATSAAAAVGMTVYNTTAGITSSNAAYPATGVGAYTWDGTGWLASKSASANNIYTNDGTLVAARTVTQAANNLTFSTTSGNLLFTPTTGGMGIGTTTPNSNLIQDVVNPRSSQWIGASFSSLYGNSGTLVTAPSKVVLGYLSNRATIGAHNNALTTWDTLGINPTGLGAIGLGTFSPKAFVDVNGTMRIGTTTSGLLTDSILTINPATGLVNRQTIAAITTGSGAATTANNGLNMITANTTQLGGALIAPTTISGITSTNNLVFSGTGPTQISNTTAAGTSGVTALRLSALTTASSIGSGAIISFDNTATELGRIRLIQESGSQHGLAFNTYNGSLAEAMRISGDGSVGIGTKMRKKQEAPQRYPSPPLEKGGG